MVGGGEGAFIGDIHRAAARLDGVIDLVCGAFSSDAGNSYRTGVRLGLSPARVYADWQTLLEREAALPAGARMEFVSIVTPNDLHLPVAVRALESGFHVLSEKPATRTLGEARLLAQAVAEHRRCYAMTHTYLGYPMIAEARARILEGSIGTVRRVNVSYVQGWLASSVETSGNKQAQWRTDPQRAGAGGCVADIGVHAFNLAEYVTGLDVTQLCASLGASLPGRKLDDDAAAFLRFRNGARGMLTASQIATGEANDLSIHVYGATGGLAWSHGDPNALQLLGSDGTAQTLRAGTQLNALHPATLEFCRTPIGHPEGFLEAFANLYRAFAADVRAPGASAGRVGRSPATIDAALRGMAFIDAMVRSNESGQRWMELTADS